MQKPSITTNTGSRPNTAAVGQKVTATQAKASLGKKASQSAKSKAFSI